MSVQNVDGGRDTVTGTGGTDHGTAAPHFVIGQNVKGGRYGQRPTLANVARFSKKDAETFREWNAKAEEITQKILLRERFAEPLPQADVQKQKSPAVAGLDVLDRQGNFWSG